jgi:hypothetical protein
VFALVCLAAYSLTVGGIPSRITLIEGNAREVQLGRPLDLRRTASGLELLPFEGGVKLVPLSQGESSLEVRLWGIPDKAGFEYWLNATVCAMAFWRLHSCPLL